MCVCSCFLHTKYQNTHFTSKVRAFLGSDILPGPHNFENLFEGSAVVLRLVLESGLVQGQG